MENHVVCINRGSISEEYRHCLQAMMTDVPHGGKSRARLEVFMSLPSAASWLLSRFNMCRRSEVCVLAACEFQDSIIGSRWNN